MDTLFTCKPTKLTELVKCGKLAAHTHFTAETTGDLYYQTIDSCGTRWHLETGRAGASRLAR